MLASATWTRSTANGPSSITERRHDIHRCGAAGRTAPTSANCPGSRSPSSPSARWTTTHTCSSAPRAASCCSSTPPTSRTGCSRCSAVGRSPRIVTTHQHSDHWQGLAAVVAATGARTYAGRDDVGGIPVATDEPLDDGAAVPVGAAQLRVITLVGHTPGSVALVYDDPAGHPHLFTGDSLFPGRRRARRRGPADFTSPARRRREEALRHSCPTTPGSIPGTATTRRWARNGPPCPSGAPEVGDAT